MSAPALSPLPRKSTATPRRLWTKPINIWLTLWLRTASLTRLRFKRPLMSKDTRQDHQAGQPNGCCRLQLSARGGEKIGKCIVSLRHYENSKPATRNSPRCLRRQREVKDSFRTDRFLDAQGLAADLDDFLCRIGAQTAAV